MPGRVKGEQPLPGAPEQLLEATTRRHGSAVDPVVTYLAVSVSAHASGRVSVRMLRRAPGSVSLIPHLLWEEEAPSPGVRQLAGILRLAAQKVARQAEEDGVLP